MAELKQVEGPGSSKWKPGAADGKLSGKQHHACIPVPEPGSTSNERTGVLPSRFPLCSQVKERSGERRANTGILGLREDSPALWQAWERSPKSCSNSQGSALIPFFSCFSSVIGHLLHLAKCRSHAQCPMGRQSASSRTSFTPASCACWAVVLLVLGQQTRPPEITAHGYSFRQDPL